MIRKVERADLPACVRVIRDSFRTVADEFGFTEENAPRFTAFAISEDWLRWQMDGEHLISERISSVPVVIVRLSPRMACVLTSP